VIGVTLLRMGSYWSIEECGWVEHTSAPEPEAVVVAPEQRVPDEEPVLTT
jgi:hypothetical protein